MTKPTIVAAITGAAGGIGRATIEILADRYDGQLFLLDIDEASLREISENFDHPGLEVSPHAVDLCDDLSVESAFADIEKRAGRLDFLFANAGIMTSPEPFETATMAEIDRSIDLNFRAVLSSTKFAWTALSAARGCVVVNASGAGRRPLASDVVYSASKAAAIMFARANAMRQEKTGIRFNVVCPGVVDTPILNDKRTGAWRQEVHDFLKNFKLIQPQAIAEAVLDLVANTEANAEVLMIENAPV